MGGKQMHDPTLEVKTENLTYAKEILSNFGGKESEFSAFNLYFHNHLTTAPHPELSSLFHRLYTAERHHWEQFGALAVELGVAPRLCESVGFRQRYWSSKELHYAKKPRQMVADSLVNEHMTVEKYTRQIKKMDDPRITELLARIIQEEKEHIKALTEQLKLL